MFAGNPNLRDAGQSIPLERWMIEEYAKCKADILYFADNYYTVKNQHLGNVPFKPRDYQRKVLKALTDPLDERRHLILLAPRQTGKTTVIGCFIAHHVLFNNDKECALLSFKEAGAVEILDRIKLGIEGLPLFLQQGISEWNKKTITFENGSKIFAAGTSKHAISGRSLSVCYLDEAAKLPTNIVNDFKNAIFPVIAANPSGKLIQSSTPVGKNHFYEDWELAKSGKSDFFPIRVPWNVAGRDEEFKQNIIKTHGKLHWNQEYACDFAGSSTTLIDSYYIDKIEVIDPIQKRFMEKMNVYQKPVQGAYYVMGIDVALGVNRDYSVCQILRIHAARKVEQVAVFRSNTLGIPAFCQIAVEISKWYNNCPIMLENNAEGSKAAYVIWVELEHDTLVNVKSDEKSVKSTNGLGVRSTGKTKIAALVGFKEYMENDWLIVVDKTTKDEMGKYVEGENGSYNASDGNDDTITSLFWATYYFYTNRADFPGADELDVHQINEENKVEENWTFVPFIKTVSSIYDDPDIADFLNGNF